MARATCKRLGFTPDIIIGHHGWGELLDMVEVWPGAPLLGYFEFYYRTSGQDVGFDPRISDRRATAFPRIRAMNAINLLALALEQHGQTPTHWQLTPLSANGRSRTIGLLPEGARLDGCRPIPQVRAGSPSRSASST